MTQIVLLIVGVVYAANRPKLARLSADEFPNVPTESFRAWKQLELRSIDIFLVATWGLAVIGTFCSYVIVHAVPRLAGSVQGIYIMLFLIGLLISAVNGSRAARMKKECGISWPVK